MKLDIAFNACTALETTRHTKDRSSMNTDIESGQRRKEEYVDISNKAGCLIFPRCS